MSIWQLRKGPRKRSNSDQSIYAHNNFAACFGDGVKIVQLLVIMFNCSVGG